MRAIYSLVALVVPCTFAAAVNAAPAFYSGSATDEPAFWQKAKTLH